MTETVPDAPVYPHAATEPDGIYARLPVRTMRGRLFEIEASEADTIAVEAGKIGDIVKAVWGAGTSNVDVTERVMQLLRPNGALHVLATNESLSVLDDPAPTQRKRLVVRYTEQYYAEENQLQGVDLDTPEGRVYELQLKNDRLVTENRTLQEALVRAERRENHFREVENRLRDEVKERMKLEQAVFENEGALVATRLAELEKDVTRLQRLLKNEQDAVLNEQQKRKRLQEQLTVVKEVKGGTTDTIQEQIAALREENARLMHQLSDINRLNVQLQLSMRDQAEHDELRANEYAAINADPVSGMLPHSMTHVRVRKSALCPKCRSAADSWEKQALSRNLAQSITRSDALPYRASSPGFGSHGPLTHTTTSLPQPQRSDGWRRFHQPGDPAVRIYHNVATARTQWEPPSVGPMHATDSTLTRV
ncbi:hypothetical protein DIPPA_27706 [Diplonema papillatum]|nr:hypothetical protein DIPPA_27706 [Diplonema papillatum]